MPRMINYLEIYENRVSEVLKEIEWTTHFLKDKYGYDSYASPSGWVNQKTLPPLNVLCDIAEEAKTNLDYLVGATTVNAPNDNYTPNFQNLSSVLSAVNMTPIELARECNTHMPAVERGLQSLDILRPNTLLAFADALGCSLDYLFGMTKFMTWSQYMQEKDPFFAIKPGEPAYIEMVKSPSKAKWVAPTRGYVLLSKDGENVIFPSGKTVSKSSEIFSKVRVIPCKKTRSR